MADFVSYLAWRIVRGVGAQAGELIQVIDHAGRDDLLREVVLAVELTGATPLVELASPEHVARLLAAGDRGYLAEYDRHRRSWIERADRNIVLTGGYFDLGGAPAEAIDLWYAAQDRLTLVEEARRIPGLLVAVPTPAQARRLGMTFEALERCLYEAASLSLLELQDSILRVRSRFEDASEIVVRTGEKHELRLVRGDRPVLCDDGYVDEMDRARGAVVSNLPAGSVHFTVLEDRTQGSLYLPQVGDARDVVFHFENGRATRIEAASGVDELKAFFNAHTGEPRRIGHVGLGLNPRLGEPIGWTLVDKHVRGAVFLTFGDNGSVGGQNASLLNEDFIAPDAVIELANRSIVA